MVSEAVDAVAAPIANWLGVPISEFAETFGDEYLALGVEIPAQFVLSNFGRVAAFFAISTGLLAYRYLAHPAGRSGKDALEIGGHFSNRFIAELADPVSVGAVAADIGKLKAGDMSGVVRPQADIQASIAALQAAYNQLIAAIGLPLSVQGYRGAPAVVSSPAGLVGGVGIVGVGPAMMAGSGAPGSIF